MQLLGRHLGAVNRLASHLARTMPRYEELVSSRSDVEGLLAEWFQCVAAKRERLAEVARSGVDECGVTTSWYSDVYIPRMRLADASALVTCSGLVRVSYGTLGQVMRCMSELSIESGTPTPRVYGLASALLGDVLFMQNGIFAAFPELDKYVALRESGPPTKVT